MPQIRTDFEMAFEATCIIFSRGFIKIPPKKQDETLETFNKRVVHTFGWALEEMDRELKTAKSNSRNYDGDPRDRKKSKIEIAKR